MSLKCDWETSSYRTQKQDSAVRRMCVYFISPPHSLSLSTYLSLYLSLPLTPPLPSLSLSLSPSPSLSLSLSPPLSLSLSLLLPGFGRSSHWLLGTFGVCA